MNKYYQSIIEFYEDNGKKFQRIETSSKFRDEIVWKENRNGKFYKITNEEEIIKLEERKNENEQANQ